MSERQDDTRRAKCRNEIAIDKRYFERGARIEVPKHEWEVAAFL